METVQHILEIITAIAGPLGLAASSIGALVAAWNTVVNGRKLDAVAIKAELAALEVRLWQDSHPVPVAARVDR